MFFTFLISYSLSMFTLSTIPLFYGFSVYGGVSIHTMKASIKEKLVEVDYYICASFILFVIFTLMSLYSSQFKSIAIFIIFLYVVYITCLSGHNDSLFGFNARLKVVYNILKERGFEVDNDYDYFTPTESKNINNLRWLKMGFINNIGHLSISKVEKAILNSNVGTHELFYCYLSYEEVGERVANVSLVPNDKIKLIRIVDFSGNSICEIVPEK